MASATSNKKDTLRDKIIAAMKSGASFTVAEIVKATGAKPERIHKHTSEMVGAKLLNRVGTGIYQLPESTVTVVHSPADATLTKLTTGINTTKVSIIKAISESSEKKLTTPELIKLTDRTAAAINTATSEMVKLNYLKRISPGLFEIGAVPLPPLSPSRKARTLDPSQPATEFKTRRNKRTQDWLAYLPEILSEMIGIEIMENPTGDRSRLGMFHEAERRVLTHKGKSELIRTPISFALAVEDFATRYEAARAKTLDQLIVTPAPEQIPVGDVTLISDEALFAEALKRFFGLAQTLVALPGNIQSALSGLVKTAAIAAAPTVPPVEKPAKRVPFVALVGLHDTQHRYILDHPPIKTRLASGTLKLEFATKSRASLELKHSHIDGVVVLPSQVGTNVVMAAHQKFPPTGTGATQKDNVIEVHGLGQMRAALVDYVYELEKRFGLVPTQPA
jgi:hypothetical protein